MTDDYSPFRTEQLLMALDVYQRAFVDLSIRAATMAQVAKDSSLDDVTLRFVSEVLDALDTANRGVKEALGTGDGDRDRP
ncbi:hypothetical protein QCE47_28020 [Caballeronia sp. LZ025]|nr:hypothetical protein [Caballeronia sp. LZ025]